jgi:hypothetical protein
MVAADAPAPAELAASGPVPVASSTMDLSLSNGWRGASLRRASSGGCTPTVDQPMTL